MAEGHFTQTGSLPGVLTFFSFWTSPWCSFAVFAVCLSLLNVFAFSSSRNYYCYLTGSVIPHQGVIQMPASIHLLTKLCVKTGHFFTLALCVRCCLLWRLPSLVATILNRSYMETHHKPGMSLATQCGRFRLQLCQVVMDVCDIK